MIGVVLDGMARLENKHLTWASGKPLALFCRGCKLGSTSQENSMAENVTKKNSSKAPAKGLRSRPKDAQDNESPAHYFARKYMAAQNKTKK